jgi:hypothetical protein
MSSHGPAAHPWDEKRVAEYSGEDWIGWFNAGAKTRLEWVLTVFSLIHMQRGSESPTRPCTQEAGDLIFCMASSSEIGQTR